MEISSLLTHIAMSTSDARLVNAVMDIWSRCQTYETALEQIAGGDGPDAAIARRVLDKVIIQMQLTGVSCGGTD